MNTTPTSDDLLAHYAGLVSAETRAIVANIVEYEIEREYGNAGTGDVRGAWILAVAAIRMDWSRYWMQINGVGAASERALDQAADMHLRTLVREGLEARRCGCLNLRHSHPAGGCSGHTEADVPPIDGQLLCGPCHIAIYQAQG